MAVDTQKIIEKVKSGTYSRQELENLRKNAGSRGAPDVVAACDEMLAKLPKSKGGRSKTGPDYEVAETRQGFLIMRSAYDESGKLLKPDLIPVAEALATNQHITDVSVLKTQVKLYFKGRHFTAGTRPATGAYWLSCLDETKITDGTVECWKQLGTSSRAKYFATHYVAVDVLELDDLHKVLECVAFT